MDHDRLLAQLRALGEAGRLELAITLAGGEKGAGELMATLGLPQPNLSRQIKVLRDAGVVVERRAGRQAFYRLGDNELTRTVVGLGARSAPAGASGGRAGDPGPAEGPGPTAPPQNMHESAFTGQEPPAPDPEAPATRDDFEEWLL